MTWKELKERIERMSEGVQNEEVFVYIGDTLPSDIPFRECLILKSTKNVYYHKTFNGVKCGEKEVKTTGLEPKDCVLLIKRDTYCIYTG